MKKLLFHNIKLKIFALLLAFVSWHAIRETISFETVLSDVPVIIKADEGFTVLYQSVDSVSITLRGAQEDIRLIDTKQLRAIIKLSANADAGPLYANITPADIKGIRSARIVQVQPDEIHVTLDREDEKLVAVNSRAIGKPFFGEVDTIICEPTVVLIRGPARQLERTDWVYTEPIDVQNRVQSFTKRAHVLPPSAAQPYQIEPPDVLVHVVISEKSESIEWTDIPVKTIMRPGSMTRVEINPSRVNIRATGSAEELEKMAGSLPRVFVDCTELDTSVAYDLPVHIHIMDGQNVSAVSVPAFVRVTMRKP